jgi:hypothetical protein
MPSPESRMPFHCNEVLFSNDAVSWCVRPVTPSDIKMQWVQHVIPFSVCFSSLSSWITSTTFLLAQVHHNAVVSILYLSTDGNVCSSACCSNRTPEPARWPQYKHIDPGWELFSRTNCLESSVRAHCINVTGMDMCSSNLFVTLLSLFFSRSALICEGVSLDIAGSNLSYPAQILFLGLHAVGVIIGLAYNSKTPDLYPNSAHGKLD